MMTEQPRQADQPGPRLDHAAAGDGELRWWQAMNAKWLLWSGLGVLIFVVGAGAILVFGGKPIDHNIPMEPPVIRADAAPIKVRPADPGGMDVPNRDKLIYKRLAGTGDPAAVERLLPGPEEPLPVPQPDVVPSDPEALPPVATMEPAPAEPAAEAAVSEMTGEEAESVPPPPSPIAEDAERVKPAQPEPAQVAMSKSDSAPPPSGAWQVQLIAVRKAAQALAIWDGLQKKHKDLLGMLDANVVAADLGNKGVFYRLRAGPLSTQASARQLCADLGSRKVDCLVIKPGS